MCIWAETMILSRNGFTGSVTNACRMLVVIGSGSPARRATMLDQPAVALSTMPQAMSPCVVFTPCIRPPAISKPVTSTPWWISMSVLQTCFAKPQTTASWRMMPPGGW